MSSMYCMARLLAEFLCRDQSVPESVDRRRAGSTARVTFFSGVRTVDQAVNVLLDVGVPGVVEVAGRVGGVAGVEAVALLPGVRHAVLVRVDRRGAAGQRAVPAVAETGGGLGGPQAPRL